MSFRKRNVGLTSGSPRGTEVRQPQTTKPVTSNLPGVRPSPLDGRPTTSTGTPTLDGLLAGHAGLPLGTSLLVEEFGTTDYAGALLRYYAAEGLVQGHHVHVLGLPEQWGRNLPGLVGKAEPGEGSGSASERMKIAWRYETLGQLGGGQTSRERTSPTQQDGEMAATSAFCHSFDLTKKLVHPSNSTMNFIRVGVDPSKSPFSPILDALSTSIKNSNAETVHRVVIPYFLSPALYPHHACSPHYVLEFMHGLRTFLAAYQGRLTVVTSLPLSLYPRSSGLLRWIELLIDGVMEISPFSHSAEMESAAKPGSGTSEEPPQGLLRIHRLPILHERGSGTVFTEDDWAFNLSRRKFSIKPFSLPPIEGDIEAQQAAGGEQKGKTADLDF